MMRSLTTLAFVFCVSACATTGEPTTPSVAPAAEVGEPQAVEEAVAETSEITELPSLPPPGVEEKAVPVAAVVEDPDERICRREVRTGTHRAVRVCRTRAEIRRMEEDSKDTFKDLHREQGFADQVDPTGRN